MTVIPAWCPGVSGSRVKEMEMSAGATCSNSTCPNFPYDYDSPVLIREEHNRCIGEGTQTHHITPCTGLTSTHRRLLFIITEKATKRLKQMFCVMSQMKARKALPSGRGGRWRGWAIFSLFFRSHLENIKPMYSFSSKKYEVKPCTVASSCDTEVH